MFPIAISIKKLQWDFFTDYKRESREHCWIYESEL